MFMDKTSGSACSAVDGGRCIWTEGLFGVQDFPFLLPSLTETRLHYGKAGA